MNKKDMALALAAAIDKLEGLGIDAFRVNESESETHTWAYYAEETDTYWLVTSEALAKLADMDYTTWAESDSTAIEYGRKAPRRAR